ncbi:unnamed protein product [Aspergillus oryzae var. brunneus]|uniref:Unnamed protein product n=1 Tax=Aspergillus oryzae var. brunneus TaxID=332754 RepID=A0ABQ6KEZ5_ASPOZ|nr:unnamed protein product [Aspergillus oryzae var. brunneus]
MNPAKPSQSSLFQVYLRLRPPISQQDDQAERCLTVEYPESQDVVEHDQGTPAPAATHIILQPPSDARKRAVEKFGFTKVFEESASQLTVFEDTGLDSIIRGVHTILGSKTQRGLTQMSLDVIFKSLASTIKPPDNSIHPLLLSSVASSDQSESQIFTAQTFLEAVYGDPSADRGRNSRAQTPMSSSRAQTPLTVCFPPQSQLLRSSVLRPQAPFPSRFCGHNMAYGLRNGYSPTLNHMSRLIPNATIKASPRRMVPGLSLALSYTQPSFIGMNRAKQSQNLKEPAPAIIFPRRNLPQRPNVPPRSPDVSHLTLELNPNSEYIVLVSMYEVYNDRIFDLLSPAIVPGQGSTVSRGGTNQKDRRRPLLFKSTEGSPDRKVVAGLRKIACSTYEEALAILEVGLTERKVTGTGANSVSSRSHGFFCLEVKRRMRNKRTGEETWMGNTLTVADLAGKVTNRATALVPFRQCKLTELLFSNSFPSSTQAPGPNRHPQKAIMVVTADPLGDYNATSQILRYSALAREVTVPRAPSATESVFSATVELRKSSASDRSTPNMATSEELEKALAEISRLTKENEALSVRLAEEEIMRAELDMRLKSSEETCLMIEQEVREECWAEMDERMEEERKKWQVALEEQVSTLTYR